VSDDTDDAAPISETLARLLERARTIEARRKLLPCYPFGEDWAAGADACEAVEAFKGCEFAHLPETCHRERDKALWNQVDDRLKLGRVPADFIAPILASVPGRRINGKRVPPERLRDNDALVIMRAFLARTATSSAIVQLAGTERILVLASDVRRGKSFAAAYAVAREGGLWVGAPELAEVDSPLYDPARNAPLLVIDDVGEEHAGNSGFGPGQIARVLCERYGRLLRTICTTNLMRRRSSPTDAPQFVERYGARVDGRLSEHGKFLALTTGP